MASRSSGRPWGRSWLLGAIVLLALWLRLWSVPWQLPETLYTDEGNYVRESRSESETGDFRNPTLFRHALDLEYGFLSWLSQASSRRSAEDDFNLLRLHVLVARWTVALLGAATVALLYVAGRRAFGPRSGLLAAALLATNLLHVHLSHFALNDVPAAFFFVAALLPAIGLLKQPTWRGLLLAGFFGGLTAATKYNFGIVLLAPLAAWSIHAPRQSAPVRWLSVGLFMLAAGTLVGFLSGMPEVLWSFGEVRDGVVWQARIGDQRWSGQEPGPVLPLYGKALLHSFGLPAILAAFVGLGFLFHRRRLIGYVLAVCPLVYLVFMAGKPLFFARFALPLVPFVCLFAAYALVSLWSKAQSPRSRAAFAALACLLVLAQPTILSFRLHGLTGETDTRRLAKQWVWENTPPGTQVAAQSYSLPGMFDGDPFWRAFDLTVFTPFSEPDVLRELACSGNRYVLISSYRWDRQRTVGSAGDPTGYELLASRGQLLTKFFPGLGATSVPLNIDDVGLPFWNLASYARPGPTIKVYALPADLC